MTLVSLLKQQVTRTDIKQAPSLSPVDMSRVTTVILGGGEGTRLSPLTFSRCKPAISFGGKFLLIDIPISNAVNSGCQKIYVITQFLSTTLHQHIYRTYRPGTFSSGFVELLTAEQGPGNRTWFQGTADAVRQNLGYLLETPAEYFLILSGDQIYNMNFEAMMRFAKKTNADLVVASLPVGLSDAKRMGLLKLNEDRFITEFHEKPQDKALLEHMRLQEFTLKDLGKTTTEDQYLASMGIYLIKRQALIDMLQNDPREDFGKHLIPAMVKRGNTAAYLYDGYWEDIGTIEAFYKANMALTTPTPAFNCYDEHNPIYCQHMNLPASKMGNTQISQTIICEGSVCEALQITNSILGPRSVVGSKTVISDSYLMGNDSYTSLVQSGSVPVELKIGENCHIKKAIIDKNVSIGKDVKLTNKDNLKHYNGDQVYIRDGIIVVTRGARIPDGFSL